MAWPDCTNLQAVSCLCYSYIIPAKHTYTNIVRFDWPRAHLKHLYSDQSIKGDSWTYWQIPKRSR